MCSERQSPAADDVAIRVTDLSKHFRIYRWPFDRVREALLVNRRSYHAVVHALSGVSFTVRRGESVGVMGRNGAGKTSLLSVLVGILAPTTGSVDIYGRVSAILGLGIGFLPQYTGRENVRNGLIALGVPTHELKDKEQKVAEFSEIGAAIDNPLRTYSAGMHMRLGFSLAISSDPDILIVDEALAVGDAAFQHKCQTQIRRFMDQGRTLVFVSHDVAMLEAMCSRGIVFDQGRIIYDGDTKDATRKYRLLYFGLDSAPDRPEHDREWGDPAVGLARLEMPGAVRLRKNVFEVYQGERARLQITVRIPTAVEKPCFAAVLRTSLGREVCGYATLGANNVIPRVEAGEFSFEARIPLAVSPGTYALELAISDLSAQPPRVVHAWEEICVIHVLYKGHAVLGMIDPGIEFVYDSEVYSLRRSDEKTDAPSHDTH
jgi:lipopolysaccharide transport system ATP-binding protein